MSDLHKISEELAKTVENFTQYFANMDDGGAAFMKILILPNDEEGKGAVQLLYETTAEICKNDKMKAEEILKMFTIIRKYALKSDETKEALEEEARNIMKIRAIRNTFGE